MSPDRSRTLVRRLSRRPRMMQLVMWVAVAVLLAVPMAAQQQGGSVTSSASLLNHAAATYELPGGATAVARDSAAITVSFSVGVQVVPGGDVDVRPGGSVVLPHRVVNTGQRTDSYALATTVPPGWQVEAWADVDGDGSIGAGDTLTTTLSLPASTTLSLLLRVTAPATATDSSAAAVSVQAQSTTAALASARATSTVTVVGPRASLLLTKSASRAEAAHGDTVTFTLAVRNDGDAAAESLALVDTLPAEMAIVPGTLARDGTAIPDAGSVTVSEGFTILRVPVELLAPASGTTVTFAVTLATGASRDSVVNRASIATGGSVLMTASAALAIRVAELEIEKTIASDTLVTLGGQLVYRLRVTNASDVVAARGVTLGDSLPAELQFVSGDGSPTVSGQVVTWTLPTLAPGESIVRDIVVRLVRMPAQEQLVNHASVHAVNAVAASVAAARTIASRVPGATLSLTKTAGALEVGLGEAVPWLITVTNRAALPLTDIVILDVLPEGMALAGRMVQGADSIRLDGRDLRIFIAGPLEPGASHAVRYNGVLTSARSRMVANRASATADAGRIRSEVAVATVRVRRGFEVENRTMLGKVWLDLNDDGMQNAGESGIAGVDVWLSDGVVVTTDVEGRFSLRDIAAGQHALRLDPSRLPSGVRLPDPRQEMTIVRADGWTLPLVDIRLVPDSDARPCVCPDTFPRTRDVVIEQQAVERTASDAVSADLLLGPAARFSAPTTRSVVHTARIYVGARGEPNRPVRLYDGDREIAEATIRGDGIHDFIGVPLAPGPHVLRLWTRNTWGNERWDTLVVHRSGPVATFAIDPDAPALHPGQAAHRPIRVRALDRWGQPVAEGTQVTVEATGATAESEDTDRSSLGLQRRVGAEGWVSFAMRGGPTTGPATVKLRSGAARGTATLPVLPVIHSMLVMGSAEVGVGATTRSYGSITARGAIDERTALTVSMDTRRAGGDDDDAFARLVDPMQSNQYPTLGDGSAQRSTGTGSGAFSARVERDYDWIEFGDITPHGMTGSARLFDYRRALTGAQGRVTLGSVVVQAFGSVTSQELQERQIAAAGSGPYALGGDLRAGTERIVVEVRARENAARVIDRRELARVSDYEIDYRTGTLLLRRPLASVDASGNPVFIVARAERVSGGAPRFVGGGRMETGIGGGTAAALLDSASIGVSMIHDASGATGRALDVAGADALLQRGNTSLEVTLLRSSRGDSSALASRAILTWTSDDERWFGGAEWTRVAPGFGGGLDPRLASGFHELRFTSGTTLGNQGRLELVHEQQYFEQYAVDRSNTFLRAEQRRDQRSITQELGLVRDGAGAGALRGNATTARGRVELSASSRTNLWLEANRALGGGGVQPDRYGAGAGYRLFGRTRLEATHFLNQVENGADYATSALNLRTETPFGGRAWGGIERASAARTGHAALLGIEERFRLSRGWEIQSMLERRVDLDAAPLEDPARSLPFVQPERDRTLMAFGLSFMPGADRSRLTIRSELQDGADQRGFRLSLAGDVAAGADAALLARSDWSQFRRTAGSITDGRQDRSLLGYAFRPTRSNHFNVLARVEWRRTLNPLGSASLTDSADSRRVIAASDAIWSPGPRTELAARYAVRWADWRFAGVAAPAAPIAHYAGLRMERALRGRVGARLDGRLLHEQSSGTSTWSLAPSLTYRLTNELRVEAGYRAGTLQDLDFGASRSKLFAAAGIHFTERSLAGAAAFWRDRLSSDR